MKISKTLLLILYIELIVICLFGAFRFINPQSTITLLMFNFLFASLTFQLKGSFHRKMGLLSAGNIVGLFWNFVFFCFSLEGTMLFGKTFVVAYTIIYPILNLLWVVPFWSLSLSFLPKFQNSPAKSGCAT
ncbi:MAG: hypothetical protein NWF05_11305 [Candidatus Bathyarchaeota archaeon]|nr:hypothetical protein [Candidatus Bathyarchaeota archaeon]